MGVGYIKDINTRSDGSAEVRVIFDGPGGRSTVWGPCEYPSEAVARAELDAAYDSLTTRTR